MSDFKVPVARIDQIVKHPNADRLVCCQIAGWTVIASTDSGHAPGDLVIYIPIDSILPPKLEAYLFPIGSKITLSKSRVKTIKIRQGVSQGMIVKLTDDLVRMYPRLISRWGVGEDVAEILGITKYEPPANSIPNQMRGKQVSKNNPLFKRYTDINHLKWYPNAFEIAEPVDITEKLHGTSARYAVLPAVADTWWKKVLKFFKLLPKNEFCYGSRHIQLQNKVLNKKLFYDCDVYAKIARQENLREKLEPGLTLYGEIVGDGIQGGYSYGCKQGEHKFYAYDLAVDGKYVSPHELRTYCKGMGIETVPSLYQGPFLPPVLDELRKGDSTVGGQKVREGIVVKPAEETVGWMGRKVFKFINDDYLLKDQTDFH